MSLRDFDDIKCIAQFYQLYFVLLVPALLCFMVLAIAAASLM